MVITVLSVSTEPFIVSEFITICLKAIECLFFRNIKKFITFIFCWRRHIFLIIIQIFTEKHFPSKFWTTDPLNMIDPSFLAFWEIYILITHQWPRSTPKTSNGVEWGWILPHDAFFGKLMKNCWCQQKITWKDVRRIIFENNKWCWKKQLACGRMFHLQYFSFSFNSNRYFNIVNHLAQTWQFTQTSHYKISTRRT